MKRSFFLILFFVLAVHLSNGQGYSDGTFKSINSGQWNYYGNWVQYDSATNTWFGTINGPTPSGYEDIIISSGDTIYMNSDIQFLSHLKGVKIFGTLICDTFEFSLLSPFLGYSSFRIEPFATVWTAHKNGLGYMGTGAFLSGTCKFVNPVIHPKANLVFNYGGSDISTVGLYASLGDTTIIENIKIATNGTAVLRSALQVNEILTVSDGILDLDSLLILKGHPMNISGSITAASKAEISFNTPFNGHKIPSSINSLKKLRLDMQGTKGVELMGDLIIEGANCLHLNSGILFTDNNSTLYLQNDNVLGGNANSYVACPLSIRVSTPPPPNSQFINFPIGTFSVVQTTYMPMRVNLATNGSSCNLLVSAYDATPSGTTNSLTIGGPLANRYYKLKVHQQNPGLPTNTIQSIYNIELEPNGIIPSLNSFAKIAFSTNNSAGSYEGLLSSVSPPFITSAQLNAAQLSDLTSADGSFIGIAKSPLSPGTYCVGPSASYTPPAFPPLPSGYLNASNPYDNISEAFEDLKARGCSGSINFELQNNYSASGEDNPIVITYKGTATRQARISVRSDLVFPRLLSMSRTNDNRGVFHFSGASYITLDGSMGGFYCSTNKGIEVKNTGVGSSSTISFANGASNIKVTGVRIKSPFNGIACNFHATGYNKDLTIECNVFEPSVAGEISNYAIKSTSTGISSYNTENVVIAKNNFDNYLNTINLVGDGMHGIWNISDNSFYSSTPGYFSAFIHTDPTEWCTFNINDNYFGGSSPYCGGTKLNVDGTFPCTMKLSPGTPTLSTFNGNTFQNMYDNAIGGLSFNLARFHSGGWVIDGNQFGNPAVANDLSSTTKYNFKGIWVSPDAGDTRPITITNNNISNVHFSSIAPAVEGGFYGIYANCPDAPLHISNNTLNNIVNGAGGSFYLMYANSAAIGNTFSYNVAENIDQTAPTNGNNGFYVNGSNWNVVGNRIGHTSNNHDIKYYGDEPRLLYCASNGTCRFDSNKVMNVRCYSTAQFPHKMMIISSSANNVSCAFNEVRSNSSVSAYSQPESSSTSGASLIGMEFIGSGTFSIHTNYINNLHETNIDTLVPISVIGMQVKVKGSVFNNEVYRLTNQAISNPILAYIIGINVSGTADTLYNNQIGIRNTPYTNDLTIYGIRKSNSLTKLIAYHNTIYIAGSSPSGKSYAFYKTQTSNSFDNTRNNIFYNGRTGGGFHAAIGNSSVSSLQWGVCDYNNLYSVNANHLGEWGIGNYLNFAQWKSTTSKDINSKNILPGFVNATGYDFHLASTNCILNNAGTSGTGIIMDIDNAIRNVTTPDIGADEFGNDLSVTASVFDSTVCKTTQSIQLQANYTAIAPVSFLWSGPNSFSSTILNPSIDSTSAIHQGMYTLTLIDANGCESSSSVNVYILDCTVNVNVSMHAFIEAYYLGSNMMSSVLMNQGLPIGSNITDTVTVELRNSIAPFSLVASVNAPIYANGDLTAIFPPQTVGNYFIVLKHRNAVETWSAYPVFIQNGASFNFNGAFQAYGNNQLEVEPGVWAMYSGDLNGDENVDLLDASLLETDINNFEFGYFATDINGDGNVDLLDSPIIEANINQFIFSSHP